MLGDQYARSKRRFTRAFLCSRLLDLPTPIQLLPEDEQQRREDRAEGDEDAHDEIHLWWLLALGFALALTQADRWLFGIGWGGCHFRCSSGSCGRNQQR